ncbi:hypothetical protein KAW50_07540 [candidate division WOR-3 bacterium]|nr:hypothetical protein [candidate division WOR-3 bacterium]
MNEEHRIIDVVKSKIGHIRRCSCGLVHINCGAVTLHLPEDVFPTFVSMVAETYGRMVDEQLPSYKSQAG